MRIHCTEFVPIDRNSPFVTMVARTLHGESISLGEGRFYGHEGVMILVADDIFMKMSFPYV